MTSVFSCSNNDEDNQNGNSTINFNINNVYLRFNTLGGPNLEDCFYNLAITDGSYEVTSTGCTPNNDIKNLVFLNEIRFDNCELANFPMEYTWTPNTPYSGMDGSNIFLNVNIVDGQSTNLTNLTGDIIKTTLIFNSTSSFNFRIELNDGRVLEKSYSGNIIEVSRENGCSLSI
jgi:hypothetical protein